MIKLVLFLKRFAGFGLEAPTVSGSIQLIFYAASTKSRKATMQLQIAFSLTR